MPLNMYQGQEHQREMRCHLLHSGNIRLKSLTLIGEIALHLLVKHTICLHHTERGLA